MNQTLAITMVPVLVPILILLIKTAIPKIPTVLLPVLAIVLPAVGDLTAYYAGLPNFGQGNPLMAAILGGAGVALREVVDQVKKLAQ